jgi:hypothetical protein
MPHHRATFRRNDTHSGRPLDFITKFDRARGAIDSKHKWLATLMMRPNSDTIVHSRLLRATANR